MKLKRVPISTFFLLAAAAAGASSVTCCYGQQFQIKLNLATDSDAESGQRQPFLPTDRTFSRGIAKASQRISQGEYSQAIRFLDEVLRSDKEDYFVQSRDSDEHVGLKETARSMIRDLPPDGRSLYEATFGPVASRELAGATAAGNIEKVRQIAFRYFHTEAGYEAALVLAGHQADLGRHLSSALLYDELLEAAPATDRFQPELSLLAALAWRAAGDSSRAESVLDGLAELRTRSATVAGRGISMEGIDRNPLAWLKRNFGTPDANSLNGQTDWLTFRGNSARNGHAEGGLPHLRERWAVRLLDHFELEEHHESLAANKLRQKRNFAVASSPLAVGDYVITRSPHNLLAIDYRTGKRVWRSQPQRIPAFEQLTGSARRDSPSGSRESPVWKLGERIWDDYLFSSISSDGDRVYVIRDLTMSKNLGRDLFGGFGLPAGDPDSRSAGTNRLCAYELASQGKLVWEVDGAANRGELSGAFFLGAPLWVGQSLYSLAEIKSAVYLLAMDRRTGKLQWRQQLAGLEANILLDQQRRLQAAVPSYDSGVLVCPTGAGVVVGVDLAKQSLAWAYRYRTNPNPAKQLRNRGRVVVAKSDHWSDAAIVIEDGRVIISPPESDDLHCLDLLSGKSLWKQKRGDFSWIAGIEEDLLLLVGKTKLSALNLLDGTAMWPEGPLRLPEEALPSGRGFFSDGKYYLPLTSAEVVAVDLKTGSISGRARSRDGRVLGNLICHRNSVISQTGQQLECFDLVDVLRSNAQQQLSADPEDVTSLRILGEIAYNEGQLSQAVEFLERSLSGEAENLRTKEVLMECLKVALDEDFARYQDRLALLRELHESTGAGQDELLRIEAEGLFKTGELLGAAEACIELFQGTVLTDQLQEMRRGHQTDLTCWMRCQMDLIWQEASPAEKEEIGLSFSTLLEKAESSSDRSELTNFVRCFGTLPLCEPALLQLAEGNLSAGQLLLAQQQFLSLIDSQDPAIRGAAVAQCSRLLHKRGLPRLALPFDERLAGELSNQICLDGATGLECLESWSKSGTSHGFQWPYGKINVSFSAAKSRTASRGIRAANSRIKFERTDAVLGSSTVLMSNRSPGQVAVHDSIGNLIFEASLQDQPRMQMHDVGSYHAVSRGNLLMVSQGSQIVAYDTLAGVKSDSSGVLWQANVTQGIAYDSRIVYRGVVRGRDRRQFAPSKPMRAQQDNQWIGILGPVSQESFIYQDQRRLMCVDPITGKTKWWRSDVPIGCDLYGDDKYLFAVPRNSKEALVFSTIDGRELGKAKVPLWQEQLATIGRNFVRWNKRVTGAQELSSIDSLDGVEQWSYSFESNSKIDIAQGRYAVIAEPGGACTIVDTAVGQVLVEQKLPTRKDPKDVHLLMGADSFVVVRENPYAASRERRVAPLNTSDYRVMEAMVMAYDRQTGKPKWSHLAEVKQEALMLSQPVDLPVIAFAGTVNHHRTKSGGRAATSLLLLEKASGRLLYHSDTLPHAGGSYCRLRQADPQDAIVDVEMPSRTIRLKFTDEPRPPEPAALVGGEYKMREESTGLLGIGLKLMGQD